jgi:hypothetical protein
MERTKINHFELGQDDIPHPRWREWEGVVIVSCPEGHTARLNHNVASDGSVTPSLLCPYCGWHVWGRLDGWEAGEKRAEKKLEKDLDLGEVYR